MWKFTVFAKIAKIGLMKHFFFDVVVRPRITHEPADALLDVYISRQYVYFRCDAYGIPEPEIHWKKVDSSVVSMICYPYSRPM